jgi:hypothetical protein
VPRTRGDRVSDYCVSIYEQAIAYLNKNGHAAVADNLEQQLQTFKKG